MDNLKCTQEEYDLAMKLLEQIGLKPEKTTFKLPKWEPPPHDPNACQHPGMKLPLFDSKAAKNMTASEVRKFFPRGNYNCPVCKQSVINYASFQHYIAGDW
jgi:hypothetical protein